jgi:hypothetical protein
VPCWKLCVCDEDEQVNAERKSDPGDVMQTCGGGGGRGNDDYLQDHTKLNKLTGKNSKVLAVYT